MGLASSFRGMVQNESHRVAVGENILRCPRHHHPAVVLAWTVDGRPQIGRFTPGPIGQLARHEHVEVSKARMAVALKYRVCHRDARDFPRIAAGDGAFEAFGRRPSAMGQTVTHKQVCGLAIRVVPGKQQRVAIELNEGCVPCRPNSGHPGSCLGSKLATCRSGGLEEVA